MDLFTKLEKFASQFQKFLDMLGIIDIWYY